MIRVSAATARKLTAPRATDGLARAHLRVKEADVTKACVGLMENHGWKAIRLQRGLMRRRDGSVAMTIGTPGMPDWCFVKAFASPQCPGNAQFWFCEFKAPGRRPSQEQLNYMADCRSRGLVAEWFDSYEAFAEFVRLTFGVR